MWPVLRANNLTTFMCRLSSNLGASTSWNTQGLSKPVMGLLYILPLIFVSRRRRQQIFPKCWHSFMKRHGVTYKKQSLGTTVRIKFQWIHIGHSGVGASDGFCEHGRKLLIPSQTRNLLSSRANFAPHEYFCSVELNFVEKLRPNSWHKLLSYAVIPDVLFTKWSTR